MKVAQVKSTLKVIDTKENGDVIIAENLDSVDSSSNHSNSKSSSSARVSSKSLTSSETKDEKKKKRHHKNARLVYNNT